MFGITNRTLPEIWLGWWYGVLLGSEDSKSELDPAVLENKNMFPGIKLSALEHARPIPTT